MTIERYRARLCARLVVSDPARVMRAAFCANLNKIDPEAAAWRRVLPPAGEISVSFFTNVYPASLQEVRPALQERSCKEEPALQSLFPDSQATGESSPVGVACPQGE
ncbi:MAG: hypothetical protein F6K28_11610 [Microcoleus sp. SIO2G3]|nr:hypothetical protein [Microcoleus sp. SIO2G3]